MSQQSTNKKPQVIVKWSESLEGQSYWYVIRKHERQTFTSYTIEGFLTEDTSLNVTPQFSFPVTQKEVRKEFEKHKKLNWVSDEKDWFERSTKLTP